MDGRLIIECLLMCIGSFLVVRGIYLISLETILKAKCHNSFIRGLVVSIPFTFTMTFFIGAIFAEKYLWEAIITTFVLSISATFAAIHKAINKN